MKKDKKYLAFSSGMDSLACLYIMKHETPVNADIIPVIFDYGQNNKHEIVNAKIICKLLDIDYILVDISKILSSESIFCNGKEKIGERSKINVNLPNSWVPFRNTTFLSIMANIAATDDPGCESIYLHTGANQVDFSGYPDCRESAMNSLQHALRESSGLNLYINNPILNMSKEEILKRAIECNTICGYSYYSMLSFSVSTYQTSMHEKLTDESAVLRNNAFLKNGIIDPAFVISWFYYIDEDGNIRKYSQNVLAQAYGVLINSYYKKLYNFKKMPADVSIEGILGIYESMLNEAGVKIYVD